MLNENHNKNAEYCSFYSVLDECPKGEPGAEYAGKIWMAEEQACKQEHESPYEFLNFVAAYVSKWDPYEFRATVARYIASFGHCSLNEKIMVARTYEVGEYLEFDKPKGRTVFEHEWEYTCVRMESGFYLYFDGRVYEKITTFNPCPNSAYVLYKVDKTLANEVKALIKANDEQIKALPKKIDCDSICDGAFDYYKFLSKRSGGYESDHAPEGLELMKWYSKIAKIFSEHGAPIEIEEQYEEVNVNGFCALYGPPSVFDEETDFMISEIQKYIEHGYPGDYDCMCFGSSVDFVKRHLKECTQCPATVSELLTYINEILRDNDDPRLAPSVAAYLVRQQIITIEENGTVVFNPAAGLQHT